MERLSAEYDYIAQIAAAENPDQVPHGPGNPKELQQSLSWGATITAWRRSTSVSRPSAQPIVANLLSGMLGLAARHGALDGNPLRDVATIPINHKEVRALTATEVGALRSGLRQWETDKKQAGRYPTVDILDVIDIMLATGARIGEALAIRWKDVDLKSAKPTVTVNGTIVYVPKKGLTIQDHPKSANSRQKYFLPSFAVEMLLRRHAKTRVPPPSVSAGQGHIIGRATRT